MMLGRGSRAAAMMALLLLAAVLGGAAAADPACRGVARDLPSSWPPGPDAVVAKQCGGGGGGVPCYTMIQEALEKAPRLVPCEKQRYVVLVRAGVYVESLTITRKNVVLLGEGAGKTIITGSKSNGSLIPMDQTATVNALGHGFLAQDLTISNTAGASANQAVALRSNSNKGVIYRCSIEGHQDTLYAENGQQFYLESNISGTVDFVFGNARAVFQSCRLKVRHPGKGKHCVVTAQGRDKPESLESGFSFLGCVVEADPEPGQDLKGVDTFLGRPYKNFSHVVFINSYLGGLINATGWVPWKRDREVKETTMTVEYIEYANTGPGADTSRRVKWAGFHILDKASEAARYTADVFIRAKEWVPRQISYDHGLGAPPRA